MVLFVAGSLIKGISSGPEGNILINCKIGMEPYLFEALPVKEIIYSILK